MKMPTPRLTVILAFLSVLILVSAPDRASAAVVGINMVNAGRFSVGQQNAMLTEMKRNGVRVIRAGISLDDKGLDFAKRVSAQGIQIVWILGLQYQDGAPTRPWQPKKFPNMWAGHPLSFADPARFSAVIEPFLARLEAEGIVFSGFELGNEINWSAFNPEFPLPGEGKGVLSLDDLYHDPEGKQIAKGYLQYLKVLAMLKEIRDRSKLNQATPVISAGLIDAEKGDIKAGSKVDAVSFSATIDFMRAHGLDQIVDGYGLHIYPNANPKTPAAKRMTALQQKTLVSECQPSGRAKGKPCWITEWGIPNKVTSSTGEADQALVVRQMRAIFHQYDRQGRLGGLIYFAWNSDAWAKQEDPFSVYRGGRLLEGGRLAIAREESP